MGAEFDRGRVCQGPSLLGAEMSRNPILSSNTLQSPAPYVRHDVPASLYLQKIYRRRADYLRDNTAKGLLTTTTTTMFVVNSVVSRNLECVRELMWKFFNGSVNTTRKS